MGITVNGNVTIHNYVEKDATVTNNYYGTVVQGNTDTVDEQGRIVENTAQTLGAKQGQKANSPMLKYFASEAEGTLAIEWLHQVIDKAKAKQKMLPLRALIDGAVMIQKLTEEDVTAEFPSISHASFHRYNNQGVFGATEIDGMIQAYNAFLKEIAN